ncbi:MAG: riboflavin synthase [Gemmatimonadaceae bacterium]
MFTGLVDDVGTIELAAPAAAGLELHIRCSYKDVFVGESIAVNGACLTVLRTGDSLAETREGSRLDTRFTGDRHLASSGSRVFAVAAVETTVARTAIGEWREGRRVNLERALRMGDRLGGHIVQGHVDGVGTVTGVSHALDGRLISVALPPGLSDLVVTHGSIAIDGVSLTVNDLPAADVVELSLIQHTLRSTALGALAAGDHVHVEADPIARYVQRAVAAHFSFSTK